jgi:hypothetical protein
MKRARACCPYWMYPLSTPDDRGKCGRVRLFRRAVMPPWVVGLAAAVGRGSDGRAGVGARLPIPGPLQGAQPAAGAHRWGHTRAECSPAISLVYSTFGNSRASLARRPSSLALRTLGRFRIRTAPSPTLKRSADGALYELVQR